MRTDLPDAVALAIDRCEGPSLVFDTARLDANMATIAAAAREVGIRPLFAAKSFPHPEVWRLAAMHFDGFDAASPGEVAALPPVNVLSIVDPSGRAGVLAPPVDRLIIGCETVDQVRAAPPYAEIAIRLSLSIARRDPAVGAVLDGSGHRRSRFGLDLGQLAHIADLAAAAGGRHVGLHVHHGPITAASGDRFVATMRAALAAAAEVGVEPRFVDAGGAWHGVVDLRAALRDLRAAVPADIEVIIEPGRAIVGGAGFACGRVLVARELDDRPLRVLDLSRICHLRWSQIELVGQPPHPGTGRNALFVGPTCFEEDVIGDWSIGPDPDDWQLGSRVVFRNVTGYAVAWNSSFGGVTPADVIMA